MTTRLRRAGAWAFGDRGGLVVFLSAIVVLGALWRVGIFITDSVTVANTLVNVADGRLAVVDSPYSITAGSQPGLVRIDGQLYGRNYGQVYLAVPLLWALDAVSVVVDLRLLLAALWSLSILALFRVVADWRDEPAVHAVGAGVALGVFALSLPVATEVGSTADTIRNGPATPIVALQGLTILVAAVAATGLYRLLSWAHGNRAGFVGGLAAILATPLGFWGTIPKRHTIVAATLLVVCFWFALSREGTDRRAVLARGGAYGLVGVLAAVHPFEAAFLLAVLLPVDLATAPRNDARTLGVVALVFVAALLPFALTNVAITGNPLEPPNIHPDAQHGDLPQAVGEDADRPADRRAADGDGQPDDGGPDGGQATDGGADDGGGTSSGDGGGGDSGPSLLATILSAVGAAVGTLGWIGTTMLAYVDEGLARAAAVGRLPSVFVRSGWIPGVRYHINAFETVDLALLEALPIAGGVLAIPALVSDRLRAGPASTAAILDALADPVRQTDVLAAAIAVTFFVVYLPLMPNNSLITLRYVVPVMPLFVYGVVRLAPVRAAIDAAGRVLGVGYVAASLVGIAGLLVAVAAMELAVGEAVQLNALVGLATALVLAGALASWPVHRRESAVAACLAAAAGATTTFLVLASLVYFRYDAHALDLVRIVAEALPTV